MEFTVQPRAALPNASSAPLLLCPSAVTSYVLPCVYALLSLTGLLGNALSLWVFFGRISAAASTPVHLCLSHLSVSNVLLSLTTPFLAAYFALGPVWSLGGFLCQLVLHFVTPVFHINIFMAVFILAWVALSRFAALVQHTHADGPGLRARLLPPRFFTCATRRRTASRVCAGVWVTGVGVILPCTMIYSIREAAGGAAGGVAHREVCYNPDVEIGGSVSASMVWAFLALFYLLYLMVLLSYAVVLRHIRQSRRNTTITTTQVLLGRVYRNIVVIQVVLSVCLLPYHIFKPIFIVLAHSQPQVPSGNNCHPLSNIVELKSCLLCLAALRGSTDPLMYFLLDKTFRRHTRRLLRCGRPESSQQKGESVTGRASQSAGQLGDGVVATVSVNFCD
ncbi:putative G-protein coupled receptor 82 [Nelusetta ayraudi]|uniref:putative G-protein coupled receptor 82 n=1 Tax=Nelusetta ayraudi TaxID=303726 RepID=UPI003F702CF1